LLKLLVQLQDKISSWSQMFCGNSTQ